MSTILVAQKRTGANKERESPASILYLAPDFSSYDSYQRLRKLYSEYKNSASFDKAVLDEFEARVNDLAEYTGEIVVHPLRDTYYFKNNKKWSKVYAYAWTKNGSETTAKNGAWPGVQISKVDVSDDNYDIYEVHFDSAGQYEMTDGVRQAACFYEDTEVFFKSYSNEELKAYVATDEPYDKAGGYAIQGTFEKYIDHIEGDYDNVVGLPLTRLKQYIGG